MRREFLLGTAILALVAAIGTGALANDLAEWFKTGFGPRVTYGFLAFVVLVPAAFGAVALVLPGRGDDWRALVVVAGAAAIAMAYVVGREFVSGLDQSDADKFAGRVWYGVLVFGAGMLIPLAGALALSERDRVARGRGSEAVTIDP